MKLASVSLDDKYDPDARRAYITGTQALVRAVLAQRWVDHAAGLHTAGFISGYRGSPLHNVDRELWRAGKLLLDHNIHFLPAINEDLAATAVRGSQEAMVFGDANYDGIFAMWYGKGPGLDRSIDAIRHAHMAGSSRCGGALIVVGDDHPMKETASPAAHETLFADLLMPVLYPANVEEVIEYALYGWALSRFSGGWAGLKMIPDTIAATTAVSLESSLPVIRVPEDCMWPDDGVHLRMPDHYQLQESRARRFKLPAALAFARANGLNRITHHSDVPRYGIVTTGKAWGDVCQALSELGIDREQGAAIGITVLKLAMPYPSDPEGIRRFAEGLEEVLVVEEKHRLTEMNVKDALYPLPDDRRPRVVGRVDETGAPAFPELPEYTPDDVARVLAARIAYFYTSDRVRDRMAFLQAQSRAASVQPALPLSRQPYFCSGCPHNTSTRVPSGSRAQGGIGCHILAAFMDRADAFTHMGGEGANWLGQAPFVKTRHVFQNLGDGTYYHSGLLAVRACIAAGHNITFKILFNDAIAMTGGQPVEGPLSPSIISRQVHGEGVRTIVVVSDDPDRYGPLADFAPGTRIEHRRSLDRVQRELRLVTGVSVLIYDQTCAAEKRRRRKAGQLADPPKRLFINELVCEGCGECNSKSNCLSVTPTETIFGNKRRIDQSSCNKDYSCVEAFCPSFVTVLGASARRVSGTTFDADSFEVDDPDSAPIAAGQSYNILVTGVGGTGVVTVTALLSMAAYLEGKTFATIDQSGIAQKGGAVISHLRFARNEGDISAVRINAGRADLVLGCDSLVAGGDVALSVMSSSRTRVLLNTHQQITGDFMRDPDLRFPVDTILARIRGTAGDEQVETVDATRLATRILGDAITSNLFLLGYACQRGMLPVSAEAIERAVELNGVSVQMNQAAFRWGRRAAADSAAVELVARADGLDEGVLRTLDEMIEQRADELTGYQNTAYAERYRALVEFARQVEKKIVPDSTQLAEAVASGAFKLMAYKDEYEVARLFTDGRFEASLRDSFGSGARIRFHMAPPLLPRRDAETGEPVKREFGPWMFGALKVLAALRGLRGSMFDLFGYTEERRMERGLIVAYEKTVRTVVEGLSLDNHSVAVQIASLPEIIRGYGHVKKGNVDKAVERQEALMRIWAQDKVECAGPGIRDSTLAGAE